MRVALISHHAPDPRGSAAGRLLFAGATGMLELGHDVRMWAWQPNEPPGPVPSWCRWAPVPRAHPVRVRGRALARPRTDIVRAAWPFPDDGWLDGAVAIAEDAPSHAATRRLRRRVLLLYYLTALDEAALGRRTPPGWQDRRAERSAVRSADLVLAFSARVAGPVGATPVPAAYPIPDHPRPPVDAPTAFVAADWRWAPNRWALDRLLRAWPEVQARVAGARLRLAGLGLDQVGSITGVEALGWVADTAELLAQAAIVPFPYPATSGPKVKIMEALASGVAVVTTPAGLEGIALPAGAGAVVADAAADPARFAAEIATVLGDPARAAALGASGREAMVAGHAPRVAAAARLAVLTARFALT